MGMVQVLKSLALASKPFLLPSFIAEPVYRMTHPDEINTLKSRHLDYTSMITLFPGEPDEIQECSYSIAGSG